jgi:ribosomal subunit interface protein
VDIVVKARRTEVPERFRQHVVEKLSKIMKLDEKLISLDVEVSKERNPRLSDRSDRIEITCRTRGPVIRAEAAADDPYAALDLAFAKLEARLRRAADRRRVHHGSRTPTSVRSSAAASPMSAEAAAAAGAAVATAEVVPAPREVDLAPGERLADLDVVGDGPLVVREKLHHAKPMTLEQALYEMELVGHDFFLFMDSETSQPAVVYRRRGYDFGVIRLAT